jgi:hypothetical protein
VHCCSFKNALKTYTYAVVLRSVKALTGSVDTSGGPLQLLAVTPRFQKRTPEHYLLLGKRNLVRKKPQQNLVLSTSGGTPHGGVSRVLTYATVTYNVSKCAKSDVLHTSYNPTYSSRSDIQLGRT